MKYCSILIFLALIGCSNIPTHSHVITSRSYMEFETHAHNPDYQGIQKHAEDHCRSMGKLEQFDSSISFRNIQIISYHCIDSNGGFKFFDNSILIKPGRVL